MTTQLGESSFDEFTLENNYLATLCQLLQVKANLGSLGVTEQSGFRHYSQNPLAVI